MKTLEKLESLGDKEIQDWLRKVDMDTLAVSLLGAGSAARGRVLANMSPHAGAILTETIQRFDALSAKELLIQTSANRLEGLF